MSMMTIQDTYRARLQAADQARINRELKAQAEHAEAFKHSDAADFVIGLISGLGLSAMLWTILWAWWTA